MAKRDYIKDREDVQDLVAELQNLRDAEEGFFSGLTTSEGAFDNLVTSAEQVAESLAESGKYSAENNNIAKEQVAAAKIAMSFGKKQTIFRKVSQAYQTAALKQKIQESGVEDEIVDSLLEQVDAVKEQASIMDDLNAVSDSLDTNFGSIGTTIRDAISNPLTAIMGTAIEFMSRVDAIGESFGAIGVTKFQSDLLAARKEFVGMGLEGDAAYVAAQSLSAEFGMTFDEAMKASKSVGDLAKSTGMSVEQSTQLVGMFSEMSGVTAEQAMNTLKMAESLATANGVAPGVILEDIAASTEAFANFSKDGGENMIRAAIHARKLGISLDTVASAGESMLDFQGSLNAEVEASVMLGRDVNLQRARQFALEGNLEGLQSEILANVGSEAEFNKMNVLQRKALARALGMNVRDVQKIVTGEKETAKLIGEMTEQDLSAIIPTEAMSAMQETMTNFQLQFETLLEEQGPKLQETFDGLVTPLIDMVEWITEGISKLDEMIGITNILKGVIAAMIVKSIVNMAVNAATAYFAAAGSNFGPVGAAMLVAAPVAIPLLIGAATTAIYAAGDVQSPADGKTRVSTKEGAIYELSKNDDFVAAPGLVDHLDGADNLQRTVSPIPTGMDSSTLDSRVREHKAKTQEDLRNRNMDRQINLIKGELTELRRDMASYFGANGSAIRGIGNKMHSATAKFG